MVQSGSLSPSHRDTQQPRTLWPLLFSLPWFLLLLCHPRLSLSSSMVPQKSPEALCAVFVLRASALGVQHLPRPCPMQSLLSSVPKHCPLHPPAPIPLPQLSTPVAAGRSDRRLHACILSQPPTVLVTQNCPHLPRPPACLSQFLHVGQDASLRSQPPTCVFCVTSWRVKCPQATKPHGALLSDQDKFIHLRCSEPSPVHVRTQFVLDAVLMLCVTLHHDVTI